MERIDYLPLGSIVYLNGGIKKLMIVARAIMASNNGKQYFFDYGGVLYPEGVTGDQMAYFNHGDISTVFFRGCDDGENKGMTYTINRFVETPPEILRGNAQTWNS